MTVALTANAATLWEEHVDTKRPMTKKSQEQQSPWTLKTTWVIQLWTMTRQF
jgi:hypothetical protein